MIRRLFCFLLALLICGGAQADALPDISQLVRLHVVAQDDTPSARALKLELRDVCLRCAQICMGDAPDADAAYMRLEEHLDAFQAACEERARELGFDGRIAAEAGRFHFPDRWYGDMHVPAGEYRALRITIGRGAGHNWWCVLYPGLCAIDEADAAGAQMPAYSRVINWLRSKLGGLK